MKYTEEEIEILVHLFTKQKPLEEIALILEKTKPSIISKLSSMGLYSRKPYTNKNGEPPRSKSDLVVELSGILEKPSSELQSLNKVNKSVIKLLIQRLK